MRQLMSPRLQTVPSVFAAQVCSDPAANGDDIGAALYATGALGISFPWDELDFRAPAVDPTCGGSSAGVKLTRRNLYYVSQADDRSRKVAVLVGAIAELPQRIGNPNIRLCRPG